MLRRGQFNLQAPGLPTLLATLLLGMWLMAIAFPAWSSEIYKSYDENGNVVYSDQPPSPEAEPLELPEANIVSSTRAQPSPVAGDGDDDGNIPLVLQMLSPVDEETFWGTGRTLDVAFEVQPEMRPGMRIAVYIDDRREALLSSSRGTINSIERGTHSIRAELLDSRGNVLTNVEPRTFFMKQYSRNFNN